MGGSSSRALVDDRPEPLRQPRASIGVQARPARHAHRRRGSDPSARSSPRRNDSLAIEIELRGLEALIACCLRSLTVPCRPAYTDGQGNGRFRLGEGSMKVEAFSARSFRHFLRCRSERARPDQPAPGGSADFRCAQRGTRTAGRTQSSATAGVPGPARRKRATTTGAFAPGGLRSGGFTGPRQQRALPGFQEMGDQHPIRRRVQACKRVQVLHGCLREDDCERRRPRHPGSGRKGYGEEARDPDIHWTGTVQQIRRAGATPA